MEKLIKINGDKLYAEWKGNDYSFDSWTDKRYRYIK